jgi:hypothetical protein
MFTVSVGRFVERRFKADFTLGKQEWFLHRSFGALFGTKKGKYFISASI